MFWFWASKFKTMKLALLQPSWTTIRLGLSPPISQRGEWLSLLPGPAHLVVICSIERTLYWIALISGPQFSCRSEERLVWCCEMIKQNWPPLRVKPRAQLEDSEGRKGGQSSSSGFDSNISLSSCSTCNWRKVFISAFPDEASVKPSWSQSLWLCWLHEFVHSCVLSLAHTLISD